MSKSKKPKAKLTETTPKSHSEGQPPADGQQWGKLDPTEIEQENLRLQGRLPFTPSLPADAVESALDALGDWPEQWLSLAEQQKPNAHAFSPALAAFKEQTLYVAKHCEKQGMDASPLVAYARELDRTYFAFQPNMPTVGDPAWVLLDRLRLWLEPFESESENNNTTTLPKLSPIESDVLVRNISRNSPSQLPRK
jgi:hypothetical protein